MTWNAAGESSRNSAPLKLSSPASSSLRRRSLRRMQLEAIDIDNRCDYGHIYPEPVLLDGHHRLAASHLASASIILANYGGRVDLLRYLIGARKSCPA